ncbi:MAG: hypothetical protein JRG79_11450 [Deltaproteobacteria bacterium]|nr:hypothetical protein [Deltaproteobacteria bacterium]
MVNMALEQATWLSEEGKKVIGQWVKAYRVVGISKIRLTTITKKRMRIMTWIRLFHGVDWGHS